MKNLQIGKSITTMLLLAIVLSSALWTMLGCTSLACSQMAFDQEPMAPVSTEGLENSNLHAANQEILDEEYSGSESEPTHSEEKQASAAERRFTVTHAIQLLIVGTIILWGYSLVMSGRHGVGWIVLAALLGVVRYFFRMIRSVFQEVTTNNEVADWEDD